MRRTRGPKVAVQRDAGDPQYDKFEAQAQPAPKKKVLRGLAPSGMTSYAGGKVPLYSAQYGTPAFVEVAVKADKVLRPKLPERTYFNIQSLMEEYEVPEPPIYMFNEGIRPSLRPLKSVP